MNDEPLIVRIATAGPLLGSRTVMPAWFISAEESANALRKKEAAVRTAAYRARACHSQPAYGAKDAKSMDSVNVRTERPYRGVQRERGAG